MEPCFTSCGDFCSDELREALRPPPSVTQLYAGSRQEIYVYAVARYPENHNPLLPVSLQKNLGMFIYSSRMSHSNIYCWTCTKLLLLEGIPYKIMCIFEFISRCNGS